MSRPVRVLLLWPGSEGAAAGNFGVPQLVLLGTVLRDRARLRAVIRDHGGLAATVAALGEALGVAPGTNPSPISHTVALSPAARLGGKTIWTSGAVRPSARTRSSSNGFAPDRRSSPLPGSTRSTG